MTEAQKLSFIDHLKFRHIAYAYAPAYALHIIEEFPRFISWTQKYPKIYGADMDVTTFWIGDGIFIAYVVICLLLLRFAKGALGTIAALSIPFWAISNGLIHISLTLVSNVYSPGAITAAGLYIPLGILLYDRAYREKLLNFGSIIKAAILGLGILLTVLVLGQLN